MALIVTDLDNTLYDWVSFFSPSFDAMVQELQDLIEVDRQTLLDEFKSVHQRYGNSEQPYAILELPSVRQAFGGATESELVQKLQSPISAFDEARTKLLHLYDSVEETLSDLQNHGHVVVGHTEAILINSYYRMTKLDITKFFTRLYTLEGQWEDHPASDGKRKLAPPPDFVETIPQTERKPNPDLLRDICNREGFSVDEAIYVGDSLTRDISMAKSAGVLAVWARYGTYFDRTHWDTLVSVTHWTDEDVKREEMLKEMFQNVQPDHTIDSFGQLRSVMVQVGLTSNQ